ncbi:MAG: CAP domain-containing protein [bacterium]|nr:CAP domain-containing protein [bacterium]
MDGFPNWEERAFLAVTNMVRMDPRGYRDAYMDDASILLEQNYPIAGPLYWNHRLNQSARYHAEDMASQDYFAHDSIDGTLWYERIRLFYPQAASLWENLAAGTMDPMESMNLLLCEGYPPCEPDLSSGDGHRQSMMALGARELGTGYALGASSTYKRYWVQDFASNTPTTEPPLVAGSHVTMDGYVFFLLNYAANDGQGPRDIRIVLDGLVYPLDLHLGDVAAGTYAIALSDFSGCSTYYFEAVDGTGDGWRYPGSGELATYGVAGCQLDYRP